MILGLLVAPCVFAPWWLILCTRAATCHYSPVVFWRLVPRLTARTSYAELDHLATVIWSNSRSKIFWSFFDSVLVAKNRALEGVKLYSRDPGNAHHFWASFWAPALNLKRHQKCKQNHQKTRGHAHKICLISGPGQITVAFWSMLCMRVIFICQQRTCRSAPSSC